MRPGLPRPARPLAAVALLALAGFVRPAAAQPEVRLGGLAYVDYYAQLATPDSAREGLHGFTFRRLYLTADAALSDAFSVRARLEASDATLGTRGSVPFVKDLYLRWRAGGGHSLYLGITTPPFYEAVERTWDFRSLERVASELNRVVSSRDFGLRADGPIPVGREGLLRYAVMFANNEGVFPEDDESKRGYALIEVHPTEALVFTLSGSVAGYPGEDGGDEERTSATDADAFVGYVTDTWRAGVEGFLQHTNYTGDRALDVSGVSVFGTVWITPAVGVVGRFDRVRQEAFGDEEDEPEAALSSFATGGLAYRPHERVRLIPNVRWAKPDDGDADLQGRFTAEFSF